MRESTRRSVMQLEADTGERERALGANVREFIARQDWLEPISGGLRRAVAKAMLALGPNVTDLLHGTWLRHPLHPMLTDVPIVAWTAAVALGVTELGGGKPKLARWTDAMIGSGGAGGLAAAMAGLADWRQISGYPRRVGFVHATLNAASLLLFGAALGLRRRGARKPGIALSLLGLISTSAAAWLGGHMIYAEGVGVDHTAFPEGPADFVPVLPERDLPEGRLTKARANGVSVLLYRRGDRISAIGETCAHQGGPLSEGKLIGNAEGGNAADDSVICRWHGSQFRLRDGALLHGPSAFDQPCFEARARDGQIEVRRAPPPR